MKKQLNGNYSYSRIIRQIRDRNQVPELFDKPQREIIGRTLRYTGFIAGLPARITFTENLKYYVSAQKPEHLDRVYNALIDKLIGVHPDANGSGSLAEMLGINK